MGEGHTLPARRSAGRWAEYALLAVLLLWQFFFVGKGIDGSDASFVLANYKWASVERSITQSGTVLSTLTGVVLYRLLPGAQMLAFRVLDALANCVVSVCALYLCGRENRVPVLLAMLGGAFYLKRETMTLGYNTFSTVLFAMAMCLLLAGLRHRRMLFVAAAGAFAGINVLFRLPNLLQASMAAAVLLYGWRDGWKRRDVWRTAGVFAGGYVCAVLVGVGVGWYYLGPESFMRGYRTLAAIGASSDSSHGVGNMLTQMRENACSAWKPLWPFLAGAAAAAVLAAVLEEKTALSRRTLRRWSEGLAVLGGSLYGIFLVLQYNSNMMIYIFAVIALLLGGVSILLARYLDAERLAWAWFLLISVPCIASGTNNGLRQCFFFGVPILGLTAALLLYWRKQDEGAGGGKPARVFQVRTFCTALLALLLVSGLASSGRLLTTFTYRDAPYDELTATVKAPELVGMHTTPERAAVLDAFYDDTRALEPLGHPLATVGHFSVGYVIYGQPPFFERTWPDLDSYATESYAERLKQQEEKGVLPIIAVVDIGDGDGLFTSDTAEEKYNMLMEFTERHGYIRVRDDEAYKLYIPPECLEKG